MGEYMKQKKELEIDGRKVTVNEFTVGQIKVLWKELAKLGRPENIMKVAFDGTFKELFEVAIQGITPDDLDNFTPSDLNQIYTAFAEVNKVFFDLASQVEGENPMLKHLRLAILNDLIVRYVGLSPEGTQEPLTTDTPSS
jgi:hypothetical protein